MQKKSVSIVLFYVFLLLGGVLGAGVVKASNDIATDMTVNFKASIQQETLSIAGTLSTAAGTEADTNSCNY